MSQHSFIRPARQAPLTRRALQTPPRAYGIRLTEVTAANREELQEALRTIGQLDAGALVVESDAGLVSNRDLMIKFAAEHSLPAVYGNADYAADGGTRFAMQPAFLMYGGNWLHMWTKF